MTQVNMYIMNQKGYHVLERFLNKFDKSYIGYVVSSRDNNVEKDYYDEIKILCITNNIPFYDRRDEYIPSNENYTFAIGWRWIIKYTNKLIVLHDSILPKYRGFAPLVNSLINGEKYIGVTALFASDEYDKGDVIQQEKVPIKYPIKIKEAISLISPLYSKLVNDISSCIFTHGKIYSYSQDEHKATYSLWRDDSDYIINWNESADTIKRKVDALGYPYMGARTLINGKDVILEEVQVEDDVIIENRDAGKIIFYKNNRPVIVCGKGLISIQKAYYRETKENILPLPSFRLRLGK